MKTGMMAVPWVDQGRGDRLADGHDSFFFCWDREGHSFFGRVW